MSILANISKPLTEFASKYGCVAAGCVIALIFLLLIPALIFVGSMIWGGVIYLVWNYVLVSVAGLTPITYWWQSVILGIPLALLVGAIRGSGSAK